jgi:hypothetical protein
LEKSTRKYFGINKVELFDYEVFEFDDLNKANEWANNAAAENCFRYIVTEERIKNELKLLESDKIMMDEIYEEHECK